MCLNCGCGDYQDKRGTDTNITMDDVEKAAEGEGMSVEGHRPRDDRRAAAGLEGAPEVSR